MGLCETDIEQFAGVTVVDYVVKGLKWATLTHTSCVYVPMCVCVRVVFVCVAVNLLYIC